MNIIHGDCLEELKKLEDNSVDAVVTDPPYGLSNTKPQQVADVLKAWVTGDTVSVPAKKGGFMGKDWDSFVPPPAVWEECMRVLKPGGHMAVFAGARTQDLMGLSIRLAGFEIRDTLGWVYGSGFPKSMDISKAIDKTKKISIHKRCGSQVSTDEKDITLLGDDGESSGYSAACLKCDEDLFPFEIEQVSASAVREVVGSGSAGAGFNPVKGFGSGVTTVGDKVSSQTWDVTAPATSEAQRWDGWGTALKPAIEPIILARKPLDGTVANNVLAHGVGGLNIDACRVPSDKPIPSHHGTSGAAGVTMGKYRDYVPGSETAASVENVQSAGRFPANVLLDEHAAKEMDKQSGNVKGVIGMKKVSGGHNFNIGEHTPQKFNKTSERIKDSGGASRFFPVFKSEEEAPETKGRFPANVLLDEHAAAEMDKQSVGTRAEKPSKSGKAGATVQGATWKCWHKPGEEIAGYNDSGGASRFFPVFKSEEEAPEVKGRFPANVLLDEHAAKEMDKQSVGTRAEKPSKSGNRGVRNQGATWKPFHVENEDIPAYSDSGGASRFFPVFKYQAKAPKKERPVIEREDGTKIQHATVKPLALMEWLVSLIVPPGGVVLHPIAGSGTTLQAAINKGFTPIGIEQDADYIKLIEKRLEATCTTHKN